MGNVGAYAEGLDAGASKYGDNVDTENPYAAGTSDHAEWERGYAQGWGDQHAISYMG